MEITPTASQTIIGQGPAPADLIKDASSATFRADVIEASQSVPVLVDFWAPWCGPCKQLGPMIEKVVTELQGKVKLVKINVDENQAIAGQMGVQSIPAVFAFAGGRPVDQFMGALPESEIKAFIKRILDATGPAANSPEAQIAEALKAANEALEIADLARAEHIFGLVLQHAPENAEALIGMASIALQNNDLERATATLEMVDEEGQKLPGFTSLMAGIQLERDAADLGSIADLKAQLAADENNHQTRFDLALALNAAGEKIEAAETLVSLMRRDREWEDDAARKKLIELLEAWGPKDPATAKGRRLLSAALFA